MDNFIKSRRKIAVPLMLTLFLTGFFVTPREVVAKDAEVLVTKYHLDIGVQQVWGMKERGETITWDDNIGPGGTMAVHTKLTFPQEVVNARAYAYSEDKFKWNDPSYTSNVGTENDYRDHYSDFASRNISVSQASSSGKTVEYFCNVGLDSAKQYDLAYNLNIGKIDEVYRLMAGPNSEDPEGDVKSNFPKLYSKLKAAENGVDPSVVAYMYFTPVIIEYQVKETGIICNACGRCILKNGIRCDENTCLNWSTPDCGCYVPQKIIARLELPQKAKQGEIYSVTDNSLIPKKILVKEGVLERKQGTNPWQEICKWPGRGAGENTGGATRERMEDIGVVNYRLTVIGKDGQIDTDTKSITIVDGHNVDGNAVLDLPSYTYEGHPVLAIDESTFTVDGFSYSAQRAYEEKVAANKFIPQKNVGASVKKDSIISSYVTFPKEGEYTVTLEVNTADHKKLTDTKSIEVRKTPCLLDQLGGFQKQNRKQVLSASVATYPNQPLTDYIFELEDLVTGERISLTEDQPQKNGATIKTRTVKKNGNEFFTNFTLEFLTKTPSYDPEGNNAGQQFRYHIWVKDKKGDTDEVEKTFTVLPDLPPQPEILMQDTFIREKETNTAKILCEDGTISDGDQLERTWSAAICDPKTSSPGTFNPLSSYANCQDLSFGSGQKMQFDKEGVGLALVKLQVKDNWNEPTLPEYISEEDYLSGETEKMTNVINIAPTVHLEPVKVRFADINILVSRPNRDKIESQINGLKGALIERGVDSNIRILPTNPVDSEGLRRVEQWTWPVSVNCGPCQASSLIVDADYGYRIQSMGLQVEGDQQVCIGPHTLYAMKPGDKTGGWNYTIKDSNQFSIYLDSEERYLCIACRDTKETILLNRKNGSYLTTLNVVFPSTPYVSADGSRMYFLSEDSIQKYDAVADSLTKVSSFGGNLGRLQEGVLSFVGKEGTDRFHVGSFDLETEQFNRRALPKLQGMDTANKKTDIRPVDLDVQGRVIFSQEAKNRYGETVEYAMWVADPVTQKQVYKKSSSSKLRGLSMAYISNEAGESKYLYQHWADNHNGTKYDYDYNLVIYDIDENGLPTGAHNIFKKASNTANWNGFTAKYFTEKDAIYLLKGADFGFNGLLPSEHIKINLPSWKVEERDGTLWDDGDEFGKFADGYGASYYRHEAWTGAEHRVKYFKNSISADEAALYSLQQKGKWSKDGERYAIRVQENGTEATPNSDHLLAKKGVESLTMQLSDSLASFAEIIEQRKKAPKEIIKLSGDGNINRSALQTSLLLERGQTYEYQYQIRSSQSAIDVFQPTAFDGGISPGKEYEEVLEDFDFTSPGIPTHFKMKSNYKLDPKHGGTGFGAGLYDGTHLSFSFTLSVDMEKRGYLEVDLSAKGGSPGGKKNLTSYYIDIDGRNAESTRMERASMQETRVLFLEPGHHTITFGMKEQYRWGYLTIQRAKAAYLSSEPGGFQKASVSQEQVTNTFSLPGLQVYQLAGTGDISKQKGTTLLEGGKNNRPDLFTFGYDFKLKDNGSAISKRNTNFAVRAPADHYLLVGYSKYLSINNNLTEIFGGNATDLGGGYYLVPPGGSHSVQWKSIYGVTLSNFEYAEIPLDNAFGLTQDTIGFRKGNTVKASLGRGGRDWIEIDTSHPETFSFQQYTDLMGTGTKDSVAIPVILSLDLSGYREPSEVFLSEFSLNRMTGLQRESICYDPLNHATLENGRWKVITAGNGKVEAVKESPSQEERVPPLVYKKGELVQYNIFYEDYEKDPSKRQYWRYTHTPYNDGPHPDAANILDQDGNVKVEKDKVLSASIPRFYIDGKYTVEHWQTDNTSRKEVPKDENGIPIGYPDYDKNSNVETLTFYIESGANAPWITSIQTDPKKVKEGVPFQLQIGVDDREKEELSLVSEVYRDRKLIYTHMQKSIKPIDGVYPKTITGQVPTQKGGNNFKTLPGNYEVVCTVRDKTGAGMGTYNFTVVSDGKILGYVNHTDQWDQNRKKYNRKRFSEEVNRVIAYSDYLNMEIPRKRGTNVFWSGEKFVLRAGVTGNANKVVCQIDGYPAYKTVMKNTGKSNEKGEMIYTGVLWNQSMINKWGKKKPQVLTFHFIADYEGGKKKTYDVQVIVDTKDDYWKLHRLW